MSTDSYESADGRLDLTPNRGTDIRVSEVIWPKAIEATRSVQQQSHLMKLVDTAGTGVILDCTLVEIGNSEIISLLMRVRNHAKKTNKEIALFNVPGTLSDIIRLCNLRSVLPTADDSEAAKKLICDLSRGKGTWRLWVQSHRTYVVAAGVAVCLLSGVALWWLLS